MPIRIQWLRARPDDAPAPIDVNMITGFMRDKPTGPSVSFDPPI